MTSLPRNPVAGPQRGRRPRGPGAGGLPEKTRVAEGRLVGAHLRDGQPGGAGRGDRRPWSELQRQPREQRPDGGESNQAANGATAVTGGHRGDVNRGCGDGDDEQGDTDPDHDEHHVRERGADSVATTPAAGLMLLQSLSGLNARSTSSHIAMLRILSRVSTLSPIPAIVATIRRGQGGSTSVTATRTSISTGTRTKAARLKSQERSGATRSNHKSASASPATVIRTARRVRGRRPFGKARSHHGRTTPLAAAARRRQRRSRPGGWSLRRGHGEHDALDRGHDLAPVPGRQRRRSHGISPPASSSA